MSVHQNADNPLAVAVRKHMAFIYQRINGDSRAGGRQLVDRASAESTGVVVKYIDAD
jgi:hypothetical protein